MYFSVNYLMVLVTFIWLVSFFGLLVSRNFIVLLIFFELLFLSICVLFCLVSYLIGSMIGVVYALFILGVVAVESAIGLSLYIVFFMHQQKIQKFDRKYVSR